MQAQNSTTFYQTYFGHERPHLDLLLKGLKHLHGDHSFVYLAGDSSLDSKCWFSDTATAVNGYEQLLLPPMMKQDICYHLNLLAAQSPETKLTVVNAAREESTIGERQVKLFPQDEFIRDNLTPNDVLVLSVGGNDIALRPTFWTIWNMLLVMKFNSQNTIENHPSSVWGLPYFINMFKDGVQDILKKLTAKQKPRKIVVCMIYFPDEMCGGWADRVLKALGYHNNPAKLQAVIRQIYEKATEQVRLPGVEVIPFPLFKTLDGKNTDDYKAAVEPSASGNRKLAEAMFPHLVA